MKYRLTVGFAFWTVLMMILPAFGSYADDEIAELINEAEENRAESAPQGYTSLKDLAMLQDRLRSYQTMGEPSEAVVDNDINVIPGLRDVFMLIASKGLKDAPRRKWPYGDKTEYIPDGTSKRFMCNYNACSGKRGIKKENDPEANLQRPSEETKQNTKLYCTRNGCFYKRRRRSGQHARTNRDNSKLSRVSEDHVKPRPKCIGKGCNVAERQQPADIHDRTNISETPESVNPSKLPAPRCKGSVCTVRVTKASNGIIRSSDDTNLKDSTRRKRSVRSCRSFKCLVLGAYSTLRYRTFDRDNDIAHPKYDDKKQFEDTSKETSKEDNHLSDLEILLLDQINNGSHLSYNLFPSSIFSGPCMEDPTKCTHREERLLR